MALPYFQQNSDKNFSLLQTTWASTINPIITLPILQGLLLKNIVLATGNNSVNTLLDRMQQGWLVVDQNAASNIYRNAPFNSNTLVLNSSAPCVISLWVF